MYVAITCNIKLTVSLLEIFQYNIFKTILNISNTLLNLHSSRVFYTRKTALCFIIPKYFKLSSYDTVVCQQNRDVKRQDT